MDWNNLRDAIEHITNKLQILPEDQLKGALQRNFQLWPGSRPNAAFPYLLPTLENIVDQIRKAVGGEMAALGVVQNSEQPFDPWVFSGVPAELVNKIGSAPRPIGTLGLAALEGKKVRVKDVHQHPAFRGLPEGHPDIRSLIALPIFYRGRPVGNIYIANKIGADEFSESDIETVEVLSRYAAFALQEAYLLAMIEVSQHQLFSLFDSAPVGVLFVDALTKETICNANAAKIFGVGMGRASLDTIESKLRTLTGGIVPPEELPIQVAMSKRKSVEMNLLVSTGREPNIIANIKVTPVTSVGFGNQLSGVLAHVENITKIKQSEALLIESETRFKRVTNGVDDGFFEWNPLTDDAYVSARWLELLGYKVGELPNKGKTYFERIHPEDLARTQEANHNLLENRTPFNVDVRLRCKNGEYKWFKCRARPSMQKDGTVTLISGAITDIQAAKLLEIALADKSQKLSEAVAARDELIGVVSHEIKNPLSALTLSVQLIKQLIAKHEDGNKMIPIIDRMHNTFRGMEKILNDLLDITSLEANAMKTLSAYCDLRQVMDRTIATFDDLAKMKGVKFFCDVPPECLNVICDADRIGQVITNLVSNSLKFTSANGSINIAARKVGQKVEIRVTDTGKGISPELLPHVFDRFWQAKDASKLGTGLGLAISKKIIEAHGETMWVESTLGVGTTFFFTLAGAEKTAQLDAV